MSRVLNYYKALTEIDNFDGDVQITPALQLDARKAHTLQVISANLTSNLPNVYSYGDINNGLVTIGNGITTIDIQLPVGVYSVQNIQNAINDQAASWYTDSTDPAFILRANPVVNLCYIIIDSTKLSVGTQFSIDFGANSSLMYELLGFVDTKSFSTDGTFTASDYAKIDWFGNMVHVYISGFGSLSITNGVSSEIALSLNLATAEVTNLYAYPGGSGVHPPTVPIRVSSFLNGFSVKFVGDRGRQIVGFDGPAYIQFQIREI